MARAVNIFYLLKVVETISSSLPTSTSEQLLIPRNFPESSHNCEGKGNTDDTIVS